MYANIVILVLMLIIGFLALYTIERLEQGPVFPEEKNKIKQKTLSEQIINNNSKLSELTIDNLKLKTQYNTCNDSLNKINDQKNDINSSCQINIASLTKQLSDCNASKKTTEESSKNN
jgi:hypothetical protein